jgi:signal transduction histidine kinase
MVLIAPDLRPPTNASVRRPLLKKYVVVFVALVSVALIVSNSLEMLFSIQENHAALTTIQRQKAFSAAGRIAQFLDDIQRQVSGAVSVSPLHPDLSPDERRGEYQRLLRRLPSITALGYIDREGYEQLWISRLDADRVGSRLDFRSSPVFNEPQSGQVYLGPVYFHDGSEPYLTVSAVDGSSGAGVTYADVNLKFVWDVVESLSGGDDYAYVVAAGGQLVAHPDLSLVLQRASIGELEHVRAALGSDHPLDAIGRNLNGQLVLAASHAVSPPGWTVFVERPLSEAYASLLASLARTALLLLAGLVLSMLVSVALARRMVRPIQALQTGALRIGAGRLEQHIAVGTGDELEALADAFNSMSTSLLEARSTLEDRVEQRTRALADALHDLDEKRRQLERASNHKSEFLASMSHELRTPLNAIIGYTRILTDGMVGDINDRQREFLRGTLDSSSHLLALIDDILDLSKIEAGRMDLTVTTFSMQAVVDNALAMVRERAQRHAISLTSHVDPAADSLEADERKVRQILFNLMANAVKFTPNGGRVGVTVRRQAGAIRVAISDTGIGIAPCDQARIFERFEQLRRPGTALEGTGLGLALTRRLVELHGGVIGVRSDVNRGSTFIVTLPRRRPSLVTEDDSSVDSLSVERV